MASILDCQDCGREIELPVDVGPRLVACPDCGQDLRIIPPLKKPPVHRSFFCSECGILADLPLDFVGSFPCPRCRVKQHAMPRRPSSAQPASSPTSSVSPQREMRDSARIDRESSPAAEQPRRKPERKAYRIPSEINDEFFASQEELDRVPLRSRNSQVKPLTSERADEQQESAATPVIPDLHPRNSSGEKQLEHTFEQLPVIKSIIGTHSDDSLAEPNAFVLPLNHGWHTTISNAAAQMEGIRNEFIKQFVIICESDRIGRADWGDMIRAIRPFGSGVEAVVDLRIVKLNRDLKIEMRAYCQKRRHMIPFIIFGVLNGLFVILSAAAAGAANKPNPTQYNEQIRFQSNRLWITQHRLSLSEDFASVVNGIMRDVLVRKGIAEHDQLKI